MNFSHRNSKVLRFWLEDNAFYSKEQLISELKLVKEGEKRALKFFRTAATKVPAYKDFLRKNKIKPQAIKTIRDFKEIPVTTKKNYIEEYDIATRSWDGIISSMHMISSSSGTTGKPHFWPRNLQHEIEGAYVHEFVLKEIFNFEKKKTLFINGFAMGNWIAGTFTQACINLVAWKGYSLTMMTPGYSDKAILDLLESIAPKFEQVVISGHTPFLKELIELARDRRIDLKSLTIKLLGTGQGITEKWREYILTILKAKQYYNTFINLFGSADAALMGFETPLSIHIRKTLSTNFAKIKEIFKDERLPSLYNYDPRLIYIESLGRELHITKDYGCPLIRYNIQDEGGVLNYNQIVSYFSDELFGTKGDNIPQWKLPFVYLYGREKFMVKIYGANIYTEHVQHALDQEKLRSFLTGRFKLEMDYDESHNPRLICRVELSQGVDEHSDLIDLTEKIFVEEVRKINSEYNFILGEIGDRAKPKIIAHKHGHSKYFPRNKIKKTA